MVLVGLAWVMAIVGPIAPEEPPPPTPTVVLSWTAPPPPCPDHATVLARIEQLVGRPLGQDAEQTLEVDARIEAEPDAFRLDLKIRGDGEILRTFSAPRCGDLLIPAAVSIAIAVDPSTPEPEPEPEPEPDSSVPAPPPEPKPEPEPEPRPQPTTETIATPHGDSSAPPSRPRAIARPRVALGLGGGLAGGLLPRAGGSLVAGVGVLLPRMRIDLEALWLTRRRATLPGGTSGGDLRLGAARPLVCRRFGGPTWHAPVCGGLELGALVGQGYGVRRPRTQRHPWLAGLATAGASWSALDRLAVRLRAELVVSPLRREFTLVDQSLFITRAVGGRLHLGLEIRLP